MAVFGFTLFLSAFLLFLAELMFAKMVLPLLGGTPAVWNTCMLFFQAALLAGYAYAHWMTSKHRPRRQALIHAALVLAPIVLLPIRVPSRWIPPSEGSPIPWLLALMLVSVGLPFLAVSTTAPVLQRWFARTNHPAAHDPYFLYAASNVGSLLGLVGYLVVIEPRLTIAGQARAWAYGYVLLVSLIGLCAWIMLRSHAEAPHSRESQSPEPTVVPSPIPLIRKVRWIGLAFVPSSLMLGLTTYATTDIAAVPLLWAVPLAVYLITFILAFARRSYVPQNVLIRALPMLALIQAIMLPVANLPFQKTIPIHLLTFFIVALLCHRALADDRPPVEHLTIFYLLMAAGGVLGGVFNSIVAPLVFRSVVEYPLVLVLACVLCTKPRTEGATSRSALSPRPAFGLYDALLPACIAGLALLLTHAARSYHLADSPKLLTSAMGLLVLACYTLSERPVRFGLALAAVLLIVGVTPRNKGWNMHQERSFFGVVRVMDDPVNMLHKLYHGTTLHGAQFTCHDLACTPTSYYSPSGPLGQVMLLAGRRYRRMNVGAIGLGAGGVTAYAKAGQSFTFYEIDPVVERIAEDTRYFTFLSDARKRGAHVNVVLGDGRLTMAKARDGGYDLIILDAFSSDSIPVHLLTREALRLYLRKLAKHGVITLNISNRYLDLELLVSSLAADAGLVAFVQNDTSVAPRDFKHGKVPSTWAVFAHEEADLGALPLNRRWHRARPRPGLRVWTDDYSNILQVLYRPR